MTMVNKRDSFAYLYFPAICLFPNGVVRRTLMDDQGQHLPVDHPTSFCFYLFPAIPYYILYFITPAALRIEFGHATSSSMKNCIFRMMTGLQNPLPPHGHLWPPVPNRSLISVIIWVWDPPKVLVPRVPVI